MNRTPDTESAERRLTTDDVGKLLGGILQDAYDIWNEAQNSDAPATDDIVADILNRALARLVERLKVLDVDMGAAQLTRAFISGAPGEAHEPVVKVTAGKLSEIFSRRDFYPGSYPFLRWREDIQIRLKILGRPELTENEWRTFARPNSLVTTLALIDGALAQNQDDQEAQVDWFLRQIPSVIKDGFSTPHSLRLAAVATLFSTEYSRRLMTDEVRGLAQPDMVSQFGLPHSDQRNVMFVPVFVHDECIGGGVIYSHFDLPNWSVPLIAGSVHILLYRLRSGDDIAAATLAAKSKAQWDATLLYTHRLAHDVRKPAQQLQAVLKEALSQYRSQIPLPFAEVLDGMATQLEQMRDLIASRVGVSVDELKTQARRDSRPDSLNQLLADAVWLWKLRARRESKTISTSVEPDPEAVVKVPRYLVVEVLENLVSNAIRFARKNVDVRASVHTVDTGRSITFAVSDDGPGISEDIRRRVSRPYYATDPSMPGLGLQLSKFIVGDLLDGGDIEISSSQEGATVTFTIPEVGP